MKYMIAIIIALTSVTIWVHDSNNQKDFESVKNSEKTLECNFRSGKRIVNPDMIVERVGFSGSTWVFVNGYSSYCSVIDTPYK